MAGILVLRGLLPERKVLKLTSLKTQLVLWCVAINRDT